MLAKVWRLVWLLPLAGFTACGDSGRPGSAQAIAEQPPAAVAQTNYPFVSFSRARLVMGAGETADAPVTVGSAPSPSTMASTGPGVVEVLPDGRLRGLGAGHAQVRSLADPAQVLEVQVLPPRRLAIGPPVATLHFGEEIQLSLELLPGRLPADPAEAAWSTTAPDVATVIDGRLRAGRTAGGAAIRARLAGKEAEAWVNVGHPRQGTRPLRTEASQP